MKKAPIFKNSVLQERFDRDGYVVFDFLSEEQAHFAAQKFYEVHKEIPVGFYADAYSSNDKLKNEIYAFTQHVFLDALALHFQDYKVLGGTYLCKSSDDEGKVGVHQDWMVVDESRFSSVTVWVPVQDVDENNGALRVLPGSHLFFNAYRSDNIPCAYRGNEQLLWDNMITIPMKAGQAFVLNHAVIHGSAINTSGKERLVVAYGLVPKQAELVFYFGDTDSGKLKVEKFNMPDDFFQRYYNVGKRPLFGELSSVFEYSVPQMDYRELVNKVNRERQIRKLPIITKEETRGWKRLISKLFS